MKQSLFDLIRARPFFTPTVYFSAAPEWWRGVLALMALGTGVSVLQVAISFLNADALRAAAEAWVRLAATSPAPPIEAQQDYNPWRPLFLPYYWLLYILVFALVRYGASHMQNLRISYLEQLGLTAWAAVPLLLSGALLGTWALITPYTPDHYPVGRIYVIVLVLLVGWGWEAKVFSVACKLKTAASTGQSVFVWISPLLTGLGLISLYIFIVSATT